MTKKLLNQNAKYVQKFIDTFEPDFVFKNRPINRFYSININVEKQTSNKNQNLEKLKKKIDSIENCNLKNTSSKIVLGSGNINSQIMVIGETPGMEEEKCGMAFKGESGTLLKKMLFAINIESDKVYLTYSINFRPPGDRKPTSSEIKRYSTFLKEHISIIEPKLIVLMGSTAMEAVTGLNNKISDERGKWKEIIIKNKTIPVIITFSPSYLLRFPENKKLSWIDLKNIKQKIKDLKIKV
tara:strand:+ start:48 stop:767 length:720 start_codon:yes stop_codon:yes gene_type:complete